MLKFLIGLLIGSSIGVFTMALVQSLFRIFSHASCLHIFRDISGKYSKIHKGFSPFFPSSLKKSATQSAYAQIRNRLSDQPR